MGAANEGGGGGHGGPGPLRFNFRAKQGPKISASNIKNIAFLDVQELYGPDISQLLSCMLQFLDNLWRLFIFSNYVGEIDHFTLDLLKRSDT